MTFLLAHLSDPHIGPLPRLPLRALLNKRLTGALNWHGARAGIHDMTVLEAIIEDIVARKPDHIAITGDLVNLGFAPEFTAAHLRLSRMGAPEQVSIVPGNHDAYIDTSLPEMLRIFAPYMRGDDPDSTQAAHSAQETDFPYLRRRGRIALIGVNSGIPTPPFLASGAVGPRQLERLAARLDQAGAEGLFRIVMIHHPPLRSGARWGRGLRDAEALTPLLARHGAELVLHGHNHRHSLAWIAASGRRIPVLGVASASAVPGTPHHHAEYHLIGIQTDSGEITIERRGCAGLGQPPISLGSIKIRHELLTSLGTNS